LVGNLILVNQILRNTALFWCWISPGNKNPSVWRPDFIAIQGQYDSDCKEGRAKFLQGSSRTIYKRELQIYAHKTSGRIGEARFEKMILAGSACLLAILRLEENTFGLAGLGEFS